MKFIRTIKRLFSSNKELFDVVYRYIDERPDITAEKYKSLMDQLK